MDSFLTRCGLDTNEKEDCRELLTQCFPDMQIQPAAMQGYCSYTVCIGPRLIVQFRPRNYKLNLCLSDAATKVFGVMAPKTTLLKSLHRSDLFVYVMERLPGISLKQYSMSYPTEMHTATTRKILCMDFARFLAKSWHYPHNLGLSVGLVGSSIKERIERLCTELPERLRYAALRVLPRLEELNTIPGVLTHGDVVPSNIMIDPQTGHLTGLVDWAEAEVLPFGICLYGLEELFGHMTESGFVYHEDAAECREVFWRTLRTLIPELHNPAMLGAVELARDVGVLLWHGFAFDDGAINRVVEEEKDAVEIRFLDTLLVSREVFSKL